MMITAHGGALGTKRNSKRFFEAVKSGLIQADAIEVDIRAAGGKLYLQHLPLFIKRRLTLEFALDFIAESGHKMNCDIKEGTLFEPVLRLAEKHGVAAQIYFTGATRPEDIAVLKTAEVYANGSFLQPLTPVLEQVSEIKQFIDSFQNPQLKGINIHYRYASEAFLQACKSAGLGLSVYTVDDEDLLRRLMRWGVDNITTNRPDLARKILEEV